MVGWHHQINGHEFERTPGDDGQGCLACCCPWGRKELDMTERSHLLNNYSVLDSEQCLYKKLIRNFCIRNKQFLIRNT